MPRYDFVCSEGHRREYILPMDKRDAPLRDRCPQCKGVLKRVFSPPSIRGEFESQTFYDYERQAWAMATGEAHENPKALEEWCAKNGKTIVPKGYKPPKPPDFEEKEALDCLQDIYDRNHNLGEIG